MHKEQTLHTKIAGEATSVNVVFEVVEDSHITIRVKSREDAFVVCYCYSGQMSTIERAADGGWLVVVRKGSNRV